MSLDHANATTGSIGKTGISIGGPRIEQIVDCQAVRECVEQYDRFLSGECGPDWV